MPYNSAFSPFGPTQLVAATAVQVTASGNQEISSYRFRNLSSSAQYFTWGTSSSVASVGAPSAGTPSANTIGMAANSVEVFSGLPNAAWFIASTSTGFEVTPGEGI